MTESLNQHVKMLDNGDSTATDYDWITGPGASETELLQQMCIVNNDAVEQEVTVKLVQYDGSYGTIFSQAYTIPAGDSAFLAEFMGQVLLGDASNPDKITVAFDTSLGASDTIDCLASSVKFA